MSNKKIFLNGLLLSLGVVIYVIFIANFMTQAENWLGQMDDNFIGPMAFLLTLVISAAITGSLVFGRPIILYLNNQKKEALYLLGYILSFLILETIITFIIIAWLFN